MAKIIDFRTGKSHDLGEEESFSGTSEATPDRETGLSKRTGVPKVDKQTYFLWLFSKDVDELIGRYVVERSLRPEEVAAILSHRLGQLVSSTEHPERLEEFCESVMRRMAQVDEDNRAKKPGNKEDEGAS